MERIYISLMIAAVTFADEVRPGINELLAARPRNSDPLQNLISSEVAFSAKRHSAFELSSHELHKPVTFERVQYNQGGNFDPQTGYFDVRQPGLYVFTHKSYKSKTRKVKLMKNNFEVQILSMDGRGKERKMNEKNILLQLEEGDKVWLRLTHGKQNGAKNPHNNSTTTTFSGYLVSPNPNDDLLDLNDAPKRRKRSIENRQSLLRVIRDLDAHPVALLDKGEVEEGISRDEVTAKSANQKIAFSVTCTKSMIGGHMADTTLSINGKMSEEMIPDGRIGFDKTLVNIGGSFDIAGGEFIAPTEGVYFFSFNVGKFPRKKLSVMLMKNVNEVQSIIYNDSKSRSREIQGQSLMLQLKKKDRVWLRSYNNDEFAVYSNLGNYITFNGYIVYEL